MQINFDCIYLRSEIRIKQFKKYLTKLNYAKKKAARLNNKAKNREFNTKSVIFRDSIRLNKAIYNKEMKYSNC
ncbi:hypothetical protein BpHYR1_002446 [Brachionus plicatilis]|uniref:Uncharacterized protein n=1 Tax=Brachionus plicatilis TaxID=10195 RepID=A0A3M7QX30_BRAPC|nr:hypothetical protein BpHYR1_002446 [Brachionus plicatilis]